MSNVKEPIIFIVSHLNKKLLKNSILQPMHVGNNSYDGNFFAYCDNSGDNIANKNDKYCELTAMYWAWKNLPLDYEYVGFFHYRRYLSFKRRFITKFIPQLYGISSWLHGFDTKTIINICNQYDLITTTPYNLSFLNKTIHNITLKDHILGSSPHYFTLLNNVINNKYKKYIPAWEKTLTQNKVSFKNIFIMKRNVFNDYMEMIFEILFEIEKQINNNEYPNINTNRLYGFISEYMIDIFINYKGISSVLYLPIAKPLNLQLNNTYFKKQLKKLKSRLNLNYIKTIIRLLKNKLKD